MMNNQSPNRILQDMVNRREALRRKKSSNDFPYRVALAVKKAHRIHEASYNRRRRRYSMEWEDAWIKAFRSLKLPRRLWYVLYLANSYSNDLHDWADRMIKFYEGLLK